MRSKISAAFITAILILIAGCEHFTRNDVDFRALNLANYLDSTSFSQIDDYQYIQRGEIKSWLRRSADSTLYTCALAVDNDTCTLTIYRPVGFIQDFKTNYIFDSTASSFKFQECNDTIFSITVVDKFGKEYAVDTAVAVSQLFITSNPYQTFRKLNAFKDRYGILGYSQVPTDSELWVFWLDPQVKLNYMSDTLLPGFKYKNNWIKEFNAGKRIKNHWSLVKVY